MSFEIIDTVINNLSTYLTGGMLILGLIILGIMLVVLLSTDMPVHGILFIVAPFLVLLSTMGVFPVYVKAIFWIVAGIMWFIVIMILIGER